VTLKAGGDEVDAESFPNAALNRVLSIMDEVPFVPF